VTGAAPPQVGVATTARRPQPGGCRRPGRGRLHRGCPAALHHRPRRRHAPGDVIAGSFDTWWAVWSEQVGPDLQADPAAL